MSIYVIFVVITDVKADYWIDVAPYYLKSFNELFYLVFVSGGLVQLSVDNLLRLFVDVKSSNIGNCNLGQLNPVFRSVFMVLRQYFVN